MPAIPKLLSDIRADVLNVRLSAANTSLWSIAATVSDRTDRAINDAIVAYPFMVQASKNSIWYSPSQVPVVLPDNAEQIIEVYAFHASDCTTLIQIAEYRHVPTSQTNLVRITIPQYALNTSIGKADPHFWISIDYEHRQAEMPAPISLAADVGANDVLIGVTHPANLARYWPRSGYAALVPMAATIAATQFEVFSYTAVNQSGFAGVTRGQMGTNKYAWEIATDSVSVQPVLTIPPEAYPVLILEAQANMYQYWVAHRAAYDQWAASSQMQQMDAQDILTLVATLRKEAQEKYVQLNKPLKRAPTEPTYMTLQRDKGTGV